MGKNDKFENVLTEVTHFAEVTQFQEPTLFKKAAIGDRGFSNHSRDQNWLEKSGCSNFQLQEQ